MLAVVRIADGCLEAWSKTRRGATPPLVVSADVPLSVLRRRLEAVEQEAFIVDVTGTGPPRLVGDDGACLPGASNLDCLRPFLDKASASPGLLEVVLIDRHGVIDDARLARGWRDAPPEPVERPARQRGSRRQCRTRHLRRRR